VTILEFFLWSLLKVVVVIVVFLLGVAYTVLLERKLVGRIQNRWGPSRVGWFGILQPLVDAPSHFSRKTSSPLVFYRPLLYSCPHHRVELRAHLHLSSALRRPRRLPVRADSISFRLRM